MTIQSLIANGNLKGAIQELINRGEQTGILLMTRYHHAMEENMLGVVTNSEHTRKLNQITHAILSMAGEDTSFVEVAASTKIQGGDLDEKALLKIAYNNKRRRPEIAKEANKILSDYRNWKDEKTLSPSFDPVGRRLRLIQQNAQKLLAKLTIEKENSLEKIIERMATLLKEPVPNYNDLEEAYKLASGRGFVSSWVANQLKQKPDDTEVRITIAEKLEAFTLQISYS